MHWRGSYDDYKEIIAKDWKVPQSRDSQESRLNQLNKLKSYNLIHILSKVARSCPTLCDPMDCSLPRLLHPWDFPGESTGVGAISFSIKVNWCFLLIMYNLVSIFFLSYLHKNTWCLSSHKPSRLLGTGWTRGYLFQGRVTSQLLPKLGLYMK